LDQTGSENGPGRRSIVSSAKAYVVRVIAVKRMSGATLALFDVADTLPQRGLQTTHRPNRPDDRGLSRHQGRKENVKGVDAEEIRSGRVAVTQRAENIEGVTGVSVKKIGG
jgi:hypothetical protein